MTDITRNKWQARGFAIVIFVLGFTAGILSLNAYHWIRNRRPADRFEQLAVSVRRLTARVTTAIVLAMD